MSVQPQTPVEVQEAVRTYERLRPRGGGSKPGLSTPPDGVTALDLSALSGVREYEPGEFVFTALAATPVAEVERMLAEHGQVMPFDPLWVDRGATLAGVVAANTAGPGRYRYGGVRDFIIGVRFVDGQGNLVRGGGKVVKNAAGFDFSKLMVGSLGRLGILVEFSFKVFPSPPAFASLKVSFPDLKTALSALGRLTASQFDLEALDLEVGEAVTSALWLRIGGPPDVLPQRLERMQEFLTSQAAGFVTYSGEEETAYWRRQREMAWAPADLPLVKVPLTPDRIPDLEGRLPVASRRRYSVGGNVAWVIWPSSTEMINAELQTLGLAGMQFQGAPAEPLLGVRTGDIFYQRVKAALDPAGRLV